MIAKQKQFKALIVTTPRGWHHESLHSGIIAVQELGKKNFFDAVLLNVIDNTFPGLEGFTGNKLWTDEWYEFGPEKVLGLNYIMSVDETSYNPNVQWGDKKGVGMGKLHPVAWYHKVEQSLNCSVVIRITK